ncbi:MAG: transcription antitermination factor NusB [Spiroplasma sp.]
MTKRKPTITQHQKRIKIIEIFYQYFLQKKSEQEFEQYLTEISDLENEKIIKIIQEILWYQNILIKEIEKHLKSGWTFKNLKPTEKAILLLATYEILYTSTEKSIIINEAIILAKQYCDNNTYKYINGVLDKVNKF